MNNTGGEDGYIFFKKRIGETGINAERGQRGKREERGERGAQRFRRRAQKEERRRNGSGGWKVDHKRKK